tara:strand:- start:687 stop:815 length:129 start_codon:yes stop_codon:yes gene_type:complete
MLKELFREALKLRIDGTRSQKDLADMFIEQHRPTILSLMKVV